MKRLNTPLTTLTVAIFFMMMCVGVNAAELMVIENHDHPNAIPNQFIVMFSEPESMMDALIETRVNGGMILHTYPSVNGFAADLTAEALLSLRANADLLSIEANVQVSTEQLGQTNDALPEPLNWGVDRIDGTIDDVYTHNSNLNGDGINVYIVDSGIDDTNSLLVGRVTHAFDNFGTTEGDVSCGDHGTGVASIIGGESGVANGVTLHSVRVLDCNVVRGHAEILAGLQWLSENVQHPAVVNLSFVMYGGTIYNTIVEGLIEQGVSVVVAAGNDNRFSACDVSPAGAEGVITVGATDIYDIVAWFNSTNEGDCIDVYAPGVDINVIADNGDMVNVIGSSFAAPLVTGCIARYLQYNETAQPADISIVIKQASTTGVLDCSFVDTFSGGEATLGTNDTGFDLGNTVPLSVHMNDVTINENGVMFTPVILFMWIALLTMFSFSYGWERR